MSEIEMTNDNEEKFEKLADNRKEQTSLKKKLGKALRVENDYVRCFLAEFIGTMIFVSFILGGVAQYKFTGAKDFLSIAVAHCFGLAMGIIVAGKVSGGHFNPAVSFAFLIKGELSLLKFILYVIAQNLGAFFAAIMVYLVYLNEFSKYGPGHYSIDSSGVFGTLPRNTTSSSGTETFSLFWDQFYATTLFITSILAICDDNNTPAKIPHTIKALLVGFSLFIIGTSFGMNCGYAVNPARDFGPRMFTLIFGWGGEVFSAGPYFFWIPIVAPMAGGLFAVLIYQLFIGNHLPTDNEA